MVGGGGGAAGVRVNNRPVGLAADPAGVNTISNQACCTLVHLMLMLLSLTRS